MIIVLQCPDIPPLTYAVPNSNSTDYGTTLTYECIYGYKYRDDRDTLSMSISCQDNGNWSAAVPDCVRKFIYF